MQSTSRLCNLKNATDLWQHGSARGEGKKDGNATSPTHLHLLNQTIPIANSAALSQPVSWPLLLYTYAGKQPDALGKEGNLAKDKKAAPAVSLLHLSLPTLLAP